MWVPGIVQGFLEREMVWGFVNVHGQFRCRDGRADLRGLSEEVVQWWTKIKWHCATSVDVHSEFLKGKVELDRSEWSLQRVSLKRGGG
jgi:hypothetical protein